MEAGVQVRAGHLSNHVPSHYYAGLSLANS